MEESSHLTFDTEVCKYDILRHIRNVVKEPLEPDDIEYYYEFDEKKKTLAFSVALKVGKGTLLTIGEYKYGEMETRPSEDIIREAWAKKRQMDKTFPAFSSSSFAGYARRMDVSDYESTYFYETLRSVLKPIQLIDRQTFERVALRMVGECCADLEEKKRRCNCDFFAKERSVIMLLSRAISLARKARNVGAEDVEDAYLLYQALLRQLYAFYFSKDVPVPKFIYTSALSVKSAARLIFDGWKMKRSVTTEDKLSSDLDYVIGAANAMFVWQLATRDLRAMRAGEPINQEDFLELRKIIEDYFKIAFPLERR